METIINHLPEYKKNQVLTETSLNATSNFLEQQERLTRFGLTQTGVIENLEFRILWDKIILEEGFGMSTDGYFMTHNYKKGSQSYTFAKMYKFSDKPTETKAFLNDLKQLPFSELKETAPFTKVVFYELLTEEQAKLETDTIAIKNLNIPRYKVTLFLEINSKNEDHCSPTTCDSGGNLKEYRVVPMLVVDDQDLLFPIINCDKELKNQIRLKRFSNLHQLVENYLDLPEKDKKANPFYKILVTEYSRLNIQNTRTLLEKIDEILEWKTPLSLGDKFKTKNLEDLKNARKDLDLMRNKYIPKVFVQDYPYNYGYISQLEPTSLLPKATKAFKSKTKDPRKFSLLKEQKEVDPNAQWYYQYYLDFCNDLQSAINEYVLQYNGYVQKHYSSYQNRVQRFLVLGRSDKHNYDQFRYYAIQNFANQEYRLEKEIFFKHYNRIPILIKKFKLGFLQLPFKKEVRFIPSRSGNCLLEDKAIPFYYKQDLELENAWIVSKAKNLKGEIYQYRDLKDPYSHFVYNINDYNFIRIEGDPAYQLTFDVGGGEVFEVFDKNLKVYNIPMNYKIVDLSRIDSSDAFQYYEHTGGTNVGGTIILCIATINQQVKVVANFQLMKQNLNF